MPGLRPGHRNAKARPSIAHFRVYGRPGLFLFTAH